MCKISTNDNFRILKNVLTYLNLPMFVIYKRNMSKYLKLEKKVFTLFLSFRKIKKHTVFISIKFQRFLMQILLKLIIY